MTADDIHTAWLRSQGITPLDSDPNKMPPTPEQRAEIDAELERSVASVRSEIDRVMTQHPIGAGSGTP